MHDLTLQVDFGESKAGQWMLTSRDPDGPRLEIDMPPQFIWHYASAAENPVTGAAFRRQNMASVHTVLYLLHVPDTDQRRQSLVVFDGLATADHIVFSTNGAAFYAQAR